jgi:transcriptional regulator with XRE-family HTH domain
MSDGLLNIGGLISDLLIARGERYVAFAERVGVSKSFISQVLGGSTAVAAPRVLAWAKALDLDADDTRRFAALAAIAHVPHELRQSLVESLRDEALVVDTSKYLTRSSA